MQIDNLKARSNGIRTDTFVRPIADDNDLGSNIDPQRVSRIHNSRSSYKDSDSKSRRTLKESIHNEIIYNC